MYSLDLKTVNKVVYQSENSSVQAKVGYGELAKILSHPAGRVPALTQINLSSSVFCYTIVLHNSKIFLFALSTTKKTVYNQQWFPWQKLVSYITTACEFLYFPKVPLRGQCTSRSYGRKIPLIYMYREITTNIIFDNRIYSIS